MPTLPRRRGNPLNLARKPRPEGPEVIDLRPSRLKRLYHRAITRDSLGSLAQIAGISSICAGFWTISETAGLIAAGLSLILVGFAAGDRDR